MVEGENVVWQQVANSPNCGPSLNTRRTARELDVRLILNVFDGAVLKHTIHLLSRFQKSPPVLDDVREQPRKQCLDQIDGHLESESQGATILLYPAPVTKTRGIVFLSPRD